MSEPKLSPEEQYRQAQARTLYKLYENDTGHPATDVEAVKAWFKTADGRRALALHRDAEGKIKPSGLGEQREIHEGIARIENETEIGHDK